MSKVYKNVYTILEKVRKGEIDSHYKNKEGLFGKINFYKKPDIVKPHLHYLDERRIETIMDTHMKSGQFLSDTYETFKRSSLYKKIPEDKRPDFNLFDKEVQNIYRDKFPKHLSKDIFKMYYNKMDRLDFEERTDQNHSKFKFLERSNNPVGKIMSENSQLKSAVFMKNVVGYFVSQLAMLKFQDEQAANDLMDNLKNGNEFNNDKCDKSMEKMLDNSTAKKMLENAINDAQETCHQLDNTMSEEQQEQMFEACDSGASEASKIDGNYIENVSRQIQSIKLSMGSLKEKIKKLMDRSISYFSAKEEVKYEDLFNADSIAGLDEYVLLHPRLRKFMAEDINIKETKKVGKIDLYIDISGSMASGCGINNDNGDYISKLDFCKAFAFKLKEMDMLNDMYTFQNSVKQISTDVITISMIQDSGGTDIDKAVTKIEKNGVNALVITDAEDSCSIYSDKAFFIGVKGSNFRCFNNDVIEEYHKKDQVVVFDGSHIYKVDKIGNVIK
jgi:vacuolar-type H+-ATPase subunit H